MARTPRERDITKRIVALLSRVPRSFHRKMHGNRMQGGGIPDLYFTCEALSGLSVWIEVKRPGEKRTDLQVHTCGVLERAGCVVLTVCSVEEVAEWLSSRNVVVRDPERPTTRSRPSMTGSTPRVSTEPRTTSFDI